MEQSTVTVKPAKPYNGNAPTQALIAAIKKAGLPYVAGNDYWRKSGLSVGSTYLPTTMAGIDGYVRNAEIAVISVRPPTTPNDAVRDAFHVKVQTFLAALRDAGYTVVANEFGHTGHSFHVAGPGVTKWATEALAQQQQNEAATRAHEARKQNDSATLVALLADHGVTAYSYDATVKLSLAQVRTLIEAAKAGA